MGVVTIGLAALEFAPLGAAGIPGTAFVKYGNVSTDSFSFAEADPTVKDVNIEESPYPLASFNTKGALILNANLADANAATYAALRGGTVTTVDLVHTYAEGSEFSNIEMTVRVTPAQGMVFTINRASISGTLKGGMGKNQELFLVLAIKALLPAPVDTPVFTAVETDAA